MNKPFDLHNYDDIINLPRPVLSNRKRMTNSERAAQFSPFAALTGYGAAVEEAARLTDEKKTLSEQMKAIIDAKLRVILDHLSDEPKVTVTYFLPDRRKAGGTYVKIVGNIKNIDEYARCIIMKDGFRLPIDAIREIEGDLFNNLEI